MHHRVRLHPIVSAGTAFALLLAAAFIASACDTTSAQQGDSTTTSTAHTQSANATPSLAGSGTAAAASTPGASGTPSLSGSGVPSEVSSSQDQWPTANFDYANSRAANDAKIDSSNVGKLGVAWSFKIPAVSAQFGSAASNPIISGNTVYFQDLGSNVYAFDLQSGNMKWKKEYNQPASGPNGPAVAYGKVFAALNDGSIVALDATSGNQLWQAKLSRGGFEGVTIQATAYDNTVWVSTVPGKGEGFYTGGDTGVLYGLDQASGKVLWHFNTVDSPDIWGQPNVNSGGGAWYPPAIDTSSGQSFWGIGNPAPFPGTKDFPNGSSRPGPDLYTDSIVSLAPQSSSIGGSATTSPSGTTTASSGRTAVPTATDTPSSGGGGSSSTPSTSSSATTASSGTPSSSGSATPSSGTPQSGAATTPESGTPAAQPTPPSPNCSAPPAEGGALGPPQGSSDSNTTGVPLEGDPAQLAWYHQVKPHDLFDLDFQASPILATIQYQGKPRDAVIGSGKLGYVVAFDRKTGDVLWKVAVGQHKNDNLQSLPKDSDIEVLPGALGGVETPMAFANGVIYAAVNNLPFFYTACGFDQAKTDFKGGTGEFVAIDANTGQYLWTQQLPSASYGAATVVNDVVFTTTFDGTLYAFNTRTGEEVYSARLPAGVNAWPAVAGDTIIIPAGVGSSPQLVALRVGAGNPLPTPAPKATGTAGPQTPGAGGGATTPSPSGSATPSSGTPSASDTSTSGAHLTVVGENISFDRTSLEAPAGTVTITFDNKDSGIPHNLHLFKGSDASGESVGATPIKPGPATDSFTVNLSPGTYYYQCDVHPLQMKGTLTVS